MAFKRIGRALGDGALGWFGPRLGAAYIRLARLCIRWDWAGREHLEQVVAARKPVVYAFWHGRILLMAPMIEESALKVKVMISANRDGELIARTIERFGADTIRGSTRNRNKNESSKGGAAAAKEALSHLAAGGIVAMTPDGPRGPMMRAQQGVALIAAQAGVAVVPAAYSVSNGKYLKSWDRFLIGPPFGRGAYVIGEPIPAPPNKTPAAIEAHRLKIEAALNAVTRRADAMTGRETPVPAQPKTNSP